MPLSHRRAIVPTPRTPSTASKSDGRLRAPRNVVGAVGAALLCVPLTGCAIDDGSDVRPAASNSADLSVEVQVEIAEALEGVGSTVRIRSFERGGELTRHVPLPDSLRLTLGGSDVRTLRFPSGEAERGGEAGGGAFEISHALPSVLGYSDLHSGAFAEMPLIPLGPPLFPGELPSNLPFPPPSRASGVRLPFVLPLAGPTDVLTLRLERGAEAATLHCAFYESACLYDEESVWGGLEPGVWSLVLERSQRNTFLNLVVDRRRAFHLGFVKVGEGEESGSLGGG